MQLDFEIVGTRGSMVFSAERFNELHLFSADDRQGRQGFRTLLAGPDTPPYGNFCPAPGHQLGFNDLKTIEVAHLIQAIAGKETAEPGFPRGVRDPAHHRGGAAFRRERKPGCGSKVAEAGGAPSNWQAVCIRQF